MSGRLGKCMPRFTIMTTLVASFSLLMPEAAQAESWLCIADMSTGFSFDRGTRQWSVAKFNVTDSRYLISSQDNKDYPYRVTKFGSNDPVGICKGGLTAETFLSCNFLGNRFSFNSKTMRYMLSYDVGYVNPTPGVNDMKEGDDTPFMEIGRCSRLQ